VIATVDKAGRILIPAELRERLRLEPGAQVELTVDGFTLHLARAVPGPKLTRRRGRLVARPTVPMSRLPAVGVAALIDEERNRWPL